MATCEKPHLAGILDEEILVLVVVTLDVLLARRDFVFLKLLVEHLFDFHGAANLVEENLIGRVARRGHGFASDTLDLEFARALRDLALRNLDTAVLSFLDQQLAADQVLHCVFVNRAGLIGGIGIDEALLGLRVVPHLRDCDWRAIDGHYDGIFGVRFHQRQDSEESLLP